MKKLIAMTALLGLVAVGCSHKGASSEPQGAKYGEGGSMQDNGSQGSSSSSSVSNNPSSSGSTSNSVSQPSNPSSTPQ